MSERYFVIKRVYSPNERPNSIHLELLDIRTNGTTSIGGQIDTRMAAAIGDWFDDGGLDDLVAALTPQQHEPISSVPSHLQYRQPLTVTESQRIALLLLAEERIAKTAERDKAGGQR